MARRRPGASLPHPRSVTRRAAVGAAGLACGALTLAPTRARAAGLGDIAELFAALAGGGETVDGTAGAQTPASARPSLIAGIAQVDPAGTASIPAYEVASDLGNVVNAADLYLSDALVERLAEQGFALTDTGGGGEFFEVYEMNRYELIPNLVTVDSLTHTYHLYFSYLLRSIERASLAPALAELGRTLLAAAAAQLEALRGTEWEQAALRCCAFFGVGAALMDGAAEAPADAQETMAAELELIGWAGGIAVSPLTGTQADYSQYIVRGYYAGDAALEPYFRAMMWYGGVNFAQRDEDLDRSALLMVLALAGDAFAAWERIYTVTSFFAGASDDLGYYEYRPLVEEAYGPAATVADLPGDDAAWQRFRELTAQTPAPAINSIPVMDEGADADHRAANKGFRLMGQRFSIDAAVMQELVYNQVLEDAAGGKRLLPDALDVPAALGSDTALAILEAQGDTAYAGYPEQMAALRAGIEGAPESLWTASLASQWLAMLRPLLAVHGEGYPSCMQGEAWARRNLLAFAGSYTELKHDTVLYAKQVMAEAGGGPLEPRDDRGFVEPEPEVFGRLAALVAATAGGLASLGLLTEEDAGNLAILQQLASQLETIARKELAAELPTEEEFELIRGYGAQLEHFWQEVYRHESEDGLFTTRDFPAAVVTDIATDPNGRVLQIGTNVATIYAVVPVEGVLRIASGAAYSFYQFEQPIDQRLTDLSWRQMLGIAALDDGSYTQDPLPDPVAWADGILLGREELWTW